jgi:hypothetical protein
VEFVDFICVHLWTIPRAFIPLLSLGPSSRYTGFSPDLMAYAPLGL